MARLGVPLILLLGGAAACGPAGGPTGSLEVASDDLTLPARRASPDAGVSDGGASGPCVQPTLAAIRASIFAPRCATGGCHASGGAGAEDLDLSIAAPELKARLLRSSAQSPSGMRLVEPGQIGASYLYLKVFLDAPVIGERMPPGEALPRCEIDAIKAWIAAGAP